MQRNVALGCLLLLAGCGGSVRPETASVPVPVVSPTVAAVAPADPFAAQPLISRATWTMNSKGRQLQVVPTHAGRVDQFSSGSARAWAEVLRLAPDADTPGMHDQFQCHWDFARAVEPDKPSWNLEPWRPAVGYVETVDALCNPGGPEG